MFKLVILLMMKSTAGHTMEVNVGGFDSIEECNNAKVEIVEKSVGWGREAKVVEDAPDRIMAVYCVSE
ncbi:hypothetical protein vBVpaMR16F_120 [Vibrio phage vB_VpaM_R16F]|nr:hypothetical protein vBVpaMR16F_120 [Vibrio phage vB_VpaM_R16F]